MFGNLYQWIKRHKDIVLYLVFGVLTTVVSYAVYFPLYNFTHLPATVCNGISWVAAVAFAFLTNKPFVFKSNDWSAKTVMKELAKFAGARIGSLLTETLVIFVTVEVLCWNGNFMKLITGVLVVIMNYVASKVFVFRIR